MSSKINGLNGTTPALDAGGGARRSSDTTPAGGSGSSSSAQAASGSDVHITASANMLADLAQQLKSLPAVDPARVAHFQSAIDSGSYTVQSGTVANGLMQAEHSLAQMRGG